jgi:hypothetical protein
MGDTAIHVRVLFGQVKRETVQGPDESDLDF